jgi:CRISPR/Cas system-associated protein endoribonuclease Cas2
MKIEDAARKLKKDFPLYAKNILKIVTKEGESKPFILNPGQKWIHNRLDQQLETQGNIRALVLKARQVGISTYVEGRFFWKITQNHNANAFVLSHLAESTN